MTQVAASYTLSVLGSPRVLTPKSEVALERKTAAVLGYLAVEGGAHKYKLAGMLWPNSGESAARNNMRQLLRRLRLVGEEIIEGDDRISLSQNVVTDVSNLSSLDLGKVLELKTQATLLEGLDYDDAPDFADWLESVREEFAALRLRAAEVEADRLEAKGQLNKALELAQLAVKLEPLSEEAHRRVIRLQYLSGDRAAALAAFERCKKILDEELGTQPSSETLELARMIERGTSVKSAAPKPKEITRLPTAILRPPVLAGREREWQLMEEAWEEGKLIFLSGEGGSGKSRLATDFVASKGKFVYESARPGDFHVPYSTHIRLMRGHLQRYKDYEPPLWVRQALSPWFPELGANAAPSPNPQTQLAEASLEVMRQIGLHDEAMVVDDFHFMDDATVQVGTYIFSQLMPLRTPGNIQGFVGCFRGAELSPFFKEQVAQMVASGMAVLIELEPLPSEAVATLLEGLALQATEHLVPGLSRYTGGNPLFILETLKHLIETDTLNLGLPSRLAPPGKVAALVTRRLQRLSPQALNLARSAAVAGTSFDMRLAAYVLERPALELAEAHAELETTQILRGNAFTHDLIFEAVLANIPAAVKNVLHTRTALHLETMNANPVLIAQHWLEANDGDRAAQWFIEGAKKANALGLYSDVVEILERAINVAVSKELRLEAQVILSDAFIPMKRFEEAIALATKVLAEADDARLKLQASSVLQNVYWRSGEYDQAEKINAQGLELAEQVGNFEQINDMRFLRSRILRSTGRYAEAAQMLEQILPYYQRGSSKADLIQVQVALGYTYTLVGRHQEAEPLLHKAFELSQDAVGPAIRLLTLSNLLYCFICQGTSEGFLDEAEAALGLGDYTITDYLRFNLALAYLRLGRLEEAKGHYLVLAESFDPNYRCIAWAQLAGLSEDAEAAVAQARDLYDSAKTPAARFIAVRAALLHGSPEQKSWGEKAFTGLDRDTLPWLFQSEYDQLEEGFGNSIFTAEDAKKT
jgi:DNA-binding SARP family transcriptional activator